MTDFRLLLPGITPEEARFRAVHGASDAERGLDVEVAGGRIRARALVKRSTQPRLEGELRAVPEGTVVQGQLRYAAPLAYVIAYGAMTLGCAGFAATLASKGEWAAFAFVAIGALVLVVVTWLSLHAGVAHKDDDVTWLQCELAQYFGLGDTLEG